MRPTQADTYSRLLDYTPIMSWESFEKQDPLQTICQSHRPFISIWPGTTIVQLASQLWMHMIRTQDQVSAAWSLTSRRHTSPVVCQDGTHIWNGGSPHGGRTNNGSESYGMIPHMTALCPRLSMTSHSYLKRNDACKCYWHWRQWCPCRMQ